MAVEENKALVRHLVEQLWNQGNTSVVDEVCSPSFVAHHPTYPVEGPEGVKHYSTMIRKAFPDLHFSILSQTAEDDRVVNHWEASGTHRGKLWGIAPTGKHVIATGVNILRLEDGRVREFWSHWDVLSFVRSLTDTTLSGRVLMFLLRRIVKLPPIQ